MKSFDKPFLLILITLISACFGYICISLNVKLHADEAFHGGQIWLFYDNQNRLAGNITVPPTYHYVIAKLSQLVGFYADNLSRGLTLLVGLLAVPFFYLSARKYFPDQAVLRSIQILFFPLIFPYFFVIYTDIWSLLAIAIAFACAVNRHFVLSGLACLLALFIRQDNIAWVGIIYLFICFENIKTLDKQNLMLLIRNTLTKAMLFNLIFIAFLIFIYVNKGVAIGDAGAHKLSSFNLTNLHIYLLYSWILFLPLHIYQLPSIWSIVKKPITAPFLIAGFLLYIATIDNSHPYNRIMYDYFIHNLVIHLIDDYPLIKVISFIPVTWTILSFVTLKLPEQRWKWFIWLAPIAAIIHPLIEPRYYIPAFFMLHVLRPRLPLGHELFMLFFYIFTSAAILYGTARELIFL